MPCFIRFVMLTAALAALSGAAIADGGPDAKFQERDRLVRNMSNMTLSVLQDQKKPFAQREAALERGIIHMVDVDWIARFVLGNAWRAASDEQRQRYTQLYRAYLTHMYISSFAQSAQRKISNMRVIGIANSEQDRFTARTEILLSTDERMRVDYLVSEKDGKNKIIDIIIENVSLLATHRAEFTKIAATQGVQGVIDALTQRLQS